MKTQSIMVLGLIAAASLISVVAFSENTTQYAVVSPAQQSLQMVGHLEMIATDPDGNIKQYIQTDNAIQTRGADCIINALFGENSAANGGATCIGDSGDFDTILIGTGTAQDLDATTVQAATSNISVNPGTGTIVQSDSTPLVHTSGFGANATVTASFNAVGGSDVITEAVLHNGTAGVALAYKHFSDISLADGDSLTVAWTVTVLEA